MNVFLAGGDVRIVEHWVATVLLDTNFRGRGFAGGDSSKSRFQFASLIPVMTTSAMFVFAHSHSVAGHDQKLAY